MPSDIEVDGENPSREERQGRDQGGEKNVSDGSHALIFESPEETLPHDEASRGQLSLDNLVGQDSTVKDKL